MNKWSIQIPLIFDMPKVLFFNVERSGKYVHSKSISSFEDLTKKDKYLYANLNELWHDVEEEPILNQWFLAQIGDDAFDTFIMAMDKNQDWKNWSNGINIKKWVYINDLLPKTEEL